MRRWSEGARKRREKRKGRERQESRERKEEKRRKRKAQRNGESWAQKQNPEPSVRASAGRKTAKFQTKLLSATIKFIIKQAENAGMRFVKMP